MTIGSFSMRVRVNPSRLTSLGKPVQDAYSPVKWKDSKRFALVSEGGNASAQRYIVSFSAISANEKGISTTMLLCYFSKIPISQQDTLNQHVHKEILNKLSNLFSPQNVVHPLLGHLH